MQPFTTVVAMTEVGTFIRRIAPIKPKVGALSDVSRAILLAICIFATPASATSIVAIWRSPEHVLVGIDSKITHKGAEPPAFNGCKLLVHGNAAYAAAGFFAGGGFDLYKLISGPNVPKNHQDNPLEMIHTVSDGLQAIVPWAQKNAPDDYATWVAGENILDLVVGYASNGAVKLHVISFRLTLTDIRYHIEPIGGRGPILLVLRDDKSVRPPPERWAEREHTSVLREVLTQTILDKRHSGLPISAVLMEPTSIKLVDEGVCGQKKE